MKSSDAIEKIDAEFRIVVSFNDADRVMQEDIMKAIKFLNYDLSDLHELHDFPGQQLFKIFF